MSQYGPVTRTTDSDREVDLIAGTASRSKSSSTELDDVGRVSKSSNVDADVGSGEFSGSQSKSAEVYGAGHATKTTQGEADFSSGEFSGSQSKNAEVYGAGSVSKSTQGEADFSSGEFSGSQSKNAEVYGAGGASQTTHGEADFSSGEFSGGRTREAHIDGAGGVSENTHGEADFSSGEFSAGRDREAHIDGAGGVSENLHGDADFSSGRFSAGGTRKGNIDGVGSAEGGADGTTDLNPDDGNVGVKTRAHGDVDVGGVKARVGGGSDFSAGASGVQTENKVDADIGGVHVGAEANTNFSFDEVSAGGSVDIGGVEIGVHIGTDDINIAGWDVDETVGDAAGAVSDALFGTSKATVTAYYLFNYSPEFQAAKDTFEREWRLCLDRVDRLDAAAALAAQQHAEEALKGASVDTDIARAQAELEEARARYRQANGLADPALQREVAGSTTQGKCYDDPFVRIVQEHLALEDAYARWRQDKGRSVLGKETVRGHILIIEPLPEDYEQIKNAYLDKQRKIKERLLQAKKRLLQAKINKVREQQLAEEERLGGLITQLDKDRQRRDYWDKTCLTRGEVKSVDRSGDWSSVRIENAGLNDIYSYWIDSEGRETGYNPGEPGPMFTLKPGDEQVIQGLAGDYFVLTDSYSECVAVFDIERMSAGAHGGYDTRPVLKSARSIGRLAETDGVYREPANAELGKTDGYYNQSAKIAKERSDQIQREQKTWEESRVRRVAKYAEEKAIKEAKLAALLIDKQDENRRVWTRHGKTYKERCNIRGTAESKSRGELQEHYFVNMSTDRMSVYFLNHDGVEGDYEGNQRPLAEIEPGASVKIQGRPDDYYSVLDRDSNCIGVVTMHPIGDQFMLGQLSDSFLQSNTTLGNDNPASPNFDFPNLSDLGQLPPDDRLWNAKRKLEKDAEKEARLAEWEAETRRRQEEADRQAAERGKEEERRITQYEEKLKQMWQSCSRRGNVKSAGVGDHTGVTFNNIGPEIIDIYWIDNEGRETNYDGNPEQPLFRIGPNSYETLPLAIAGDFYFVVDGYSRECIAVIEARADGYPIEVGARVASDSRDR